MDEKTFRRLGHEIIDWIADYREGMRALPVMSPVQPGAIKAAFTGEPPRAGGLADQAIEILERDVLPGITHWNHPSFFAYFPSNADLAAVLADLVSTGLGVQSMSWQTSPAATELEQVTVEWLRKMTGLPESFSGVIHDTASTATLVATVDEKMVR